MHRFDQCFQSDWWEFDWFTPYAFGIILFNRKSRFVLMKSTISSMVTDFWYHVVDWGRRSPIRRILIWPQQIYRRECKSRTVFLVCPSMNRHLRWSEKFEHVLYSLRALFLRNWRHIVPDPFVEMLERFVRPNMRWDCPRSPLECIIPIHSSTPTVYDDTLTWLICREKNTEILSVFRVVFFSVLTVTLTTSKDRNIGLLSHEHAGTKDAAYHCRWTEDAGRPSLPIRMLTVLTRKHQPLFGIHIRCNIYHSTELTSDNGPFVSKNMSERSGQKEWCYQWTSIQNCQWIETDVCLSVHTRL